MLIPDGYEFSVKTYPGQSGKTWKLKAPDGRVFGKYVHEFTKDAEIEEGVKETIRCIEENLFPCKKEEASDAR